MKHIERTMQACVKSISYDVISETGKLYMEDGDCCDMLGCIGFFKTIDPSVSLILTFSGDKKDTEYRRKEDDESEWLAVCVYG